MNRKYKDAYLTEIHSKYKQNYSPLNPSQAMVIMNWSRDYYCYIYRIGRCPLVKLNVLMFLLLFPAVNNLRLFSEPIGRLEVLYNPLQYQSSPPDSQTPCPGFAFLSFILVVTPIVSNCLLWLCILVCLVVAVASTLLLLFLCLFQLHCHDVCMVQCKPALSNALSLAVKLNSSAKNPAMLLLWLLFHLLYP